MSELDLLEKAVLGTTGAAGAVMLLFKLMSFVKKEQASQASDGAIKSQFDSLQEQIKSMQSDNIELRAAFAMMDRKLHVQQRTITRMEMLLRQFSGLVSHKGIPVPDYMQEELEALIDSDVERQVTPDARAFP